MAAAHALTGWAILAVLYAVLVVVLVRRDGSRTALIQVAALTVAVGLTLLAGALISGGGLQ